MGDHRQSQTGRLAGLDEEAQCGSAEGVTELISEGLLWAGRDVPSIGKRSFQCCFRIMLDGII